MNNSKRLAAIVLFEHAKMVGAKKGFMYPIPNCAGITRKDELKNLSQEGRILGAPDLVWLIENKVIYFRAVEEGKTLLRRQRLYDDRLRKYGHVVHILSHPGDWERLRKKIMKDIDKENYQRPDLWPKLN